MTPFVSVIVPTRDRPERLAECLEHLARLDYPRNRLEVVVVDDGSRAPLEGVIARFAGRVPLTLVPQPPSGPARARNTGAEQAHGNILAFTDDDCLADRRWLRELVERLELAPGSVVGGSVVNALPANPWSSASQLLCDYLNRYYNRNPSDARFFTSNNIAMAAARFRGLGGFDSSYPLAAAEDRDLCDRLLGSGARLAFEPGAVVFHAHALGAGGFLRQHFRYGRGARHFHRERSRRTGAGMRFEPPSFYLGLLAAPFSKDDGPHAVALSALIVLSQLANAAGFAWELARPTPRQPPARSHRDFR